MDTPELARHEAAAERCKMERWAVDLTQDTVRVVTTTGRAIGTFSTPEDAIAVCWLHEQQAALVAALADAIKARTDAVIAMERAVDAERAAVDRGNRIERQARTEVGDLSGQLATARQNLDICQRSKNETERSLTAHQGLADAVEQWVKFRHSPNLLAAWDRFRAEKARGY